MNKRFPRAIKSLLPIFSLSVFLFLANNASAFSNPSVNPTGGAGSIYIEASTPANTFYLKSNGNVGIGTTSPAQKLDVNGSVKVPKASATDNASPGLIYASSDDFLYNTLYINHYGFGFHRPIAYSASETGAYMSGYFGIDLFTGGVSRLSILSGGNIGIGKTNPTTALDVNGTVTATAFAGPLSGSISSANVSAGAFGSNTGGGNYSFPANVGIGTATPAAKLDVAGGINMTGVLDAGSGTASGYRFNGRSISWNSSMQDPASYVPHILQQTYTGWDPVLGVKTTNGFWQMGAYSSDTLHLGYMTGAFGSHATNAFDNSIAITPSNVAIGNVGTMGLTVSGNVGIGNTSPAAKLDVSGAAYLPQIYINRSSGAGRGISWYSPTYTSWTDYMCQAGQTSCGPNANLTTPTGTLVTSWGQRSFIENLAGYGWTFESGASTGQPAVVAEIRSSDGSAKFNGTVTANAFTGPLTGTTSAANVSSGNFGANTGGGNYAFPANVGINITSPATYLHVNGVTDTSPTTHGLFVLGDIAGGNISIDQNEIEARTNGVMSTLYAQADGGDFFLHSAVAGTQFLVTSAGNVGISNTAPQAKLDILQSNTINTTTPGTGRYGIHLTPADTVADKAVGITFGAGDTSTGTTAQAGIYSQYSGAYGTKLYFATTNNYSTGAKTAMMIDAAGNVGIGTISPVYKLDVAGAVRATNFLGGPLNSLGDYVWSSATTAQNLPNGISSSFVQAANGFPSYGTVINARTYSGGGGGGVQIYAPYGNGYGGTSLQYRLADYSANTADPPWTPWKTIADSDNGYQGAAFVPSGAGMVMIGPNAVTRYGGGAWDGQVYSKEGFTGGAYVSTVVKSLSYSYMFGLNTDPTTDASYCSIDFAWYVTASTNGYIYESCGNPASGITVAVGDVLAISYDGANIKYIQNGIVRRTVAAYITNPLYFDSSFVNGLPTGPTISNIQFNALTGSSCRLISYSGGTTACPAGYYTWSGTALASGYMLCCRVENPI